MVEVARIERPSCGLAKSSKTPARSEAADSIPRVIESLIVRFINP
jgi:hypothetical protein